MFLVLQFVLMKYLQSLTNNTIVHDKKRTDILFECEMKLLTQNPKSYSNIPERNIMGLAAVSNTFQGPRMSMLNANDLEYNKTVSSLNLMSSLYIYIMLCTPHTHVYICIRTCIFIIHFSFRWKSIICKKCFYNFSQLLRFMPPEN